MITHAGGGSRRRSDERARSRRDAAGEPGIRGVLCGKRIYFTPNRSSDRGKGQQYTGAHDDLDRIGHMISADIYQRITGKRRTFD